MHLEESREQLQGHNRSLKNSIWERMNLWVNSAPTEKWLTGVWLLTLSDAFEYTQVIAIIYLDNVQK
ncbi:hypothetical protein EBR03_05985 [bacterium]|nr:hypothetical protein [bacterium]